MGNWTTVHISGMCDKKDLPALKKAIDKGNDYENFHCLCNTGGLCGIGDWVNEDISVVGNLAERDYGQDDIKDKLQDLAKIAPSLTLKVHVGGDYESLDCVATVVCAEGEVNINSPEINKLPSIPQGQIHGNLMMALMGKSRGGA